MNSVWVAGAGQVRIEKRSAASLRMMAAEAVRSALVDASLTSEAIDGLIASSMLSDELQGQKNIGALIADESGLAGVEAFECRAATASGAAALRSAILAIAAGAMTTVVVIGVEKMSDGVPTPVLAKALDAEREVPDGATLVSQNARLMARYMQQYQAPASGLAHFSVNAHLNALDNPKALFPDRRIQVEDVLESRLISPPIRLLDCSPICDGAAAIVLTSDPAIAGVQGDRIRVLASTGATDRFRSDEREDPLALAAARRSSQAAFAQTELAPTDVDFFEVHDAFSIMACLLLEANGFAQPGEGWRVAADGDIRPGERIPLSTRGGLKARGHPIGATALYQVGEVVDQIWGRAGGNQLKEPEFALMQSVGGVATSVFTHLFCRE